MLIPIGNILTDPQVQLSERFIDKSTVQQYVEAIASGAEFPPVIVYQDNGNYYLADGFHRVAAYRFTGLAEVEAEIRQGNKKDAMIHAATANVANGKPMSAKEKRQAGERLIKLTNWSDHEIASRLAMNHSTVSKWRPSIEISIDKPKRTVTRDGTTYTMKTTNIGKAAPQLQSGPGPVTLWDDDADDKIDTREPGPRPVIYMPEPEPTEWSASITLLCGDFTQLGSTLEPGSFDLIITDPPYPQEYLHLYRLLSEQAAILLKPGGSLLAMAGQSYLPEVMAHLSGTLTYHWIISYDTPGGQSPQIWDRKVNAFWKPILWYVKGKYDGKWHGDKIASNVNDNDKRFHGWGQSESGIGKLVSEFASFGTGKVLDPFMGGGTTAVVCYRLRIPFVGIDIDSESVKTATQRIQDEMRQYDK